VDGGLLKPVEVKRVSPCGNVSGGVGSFEKGFLNGRISKGRPRELMLTRIFLMLGTSFWMCFFGTGQAYILKAQFWMSSF